MFDKDSCPVHELEDAVVAGASRLAASTAAWLVLLAAFDRREGWAGVGIRSCAHWLSWKAGLGLRAAYEHLRVARALETLPALREAFTAGRLSYAKARALARVATPTTDASLVDLALAMPAAHLERFLRAYRTTTLDSTNQRHHRRGVSWRYTHTDDSFLLTARLDPEEGATVIKAITRAADALTPPDTHTDPPGYTTTVGARNADAFVAISETFLAGGAEPTTDPDRYTVVIHTDADLLTDTTDSPTTPTPSHLDDGPALHPATVSRILCDAPTITLTRLRTATTTTGPLPGAPLGPGETLIDLGRKTRHPSPALRRAVHYRDHHRCRFPTCAATRYLDIHHIRPWHPDGPTDLCNLLTLCRTHHRLHHEGGYTVTVTSTGEVVFHRPDGSAIPVTPPPPTLTDTPDQQSPRPIDPDAIIPAWYGDPLDINLAITTLTSRHHAA
jgi:Domain of unknown function (DUF222)